MTKVYSIQVKVYNSTIKNNGSVVKYVVMVSFLYNVMEKDQLLQRLGARLRELRTLKGISQKELAYSIGKDQQSIQRLETGKINPSFYYLSQIAEGLKVDLSELFAFPPLS